MVMRSLPSRACKPRFPRNPIIAVLLAVGLLALSSSWLRGDGEDAPWKTMKAKPLDEAGIQALQAEWAACADCHEDVDLVAMKGSVHGSWLRCVDCHEAFSLGEGGEHPEPEGEASARRATYLAACEKCHADVSAVYRKSAHAAAGKDVGCARCHDAHAVQRAALADDKVAGYCKKCHLEAAREFEGSAHAKGGELTCRDCHGVHETKGSGLEGAALTRFCGECHDEAAKSLAGSAHGANEMSCRDCHGVHALKNAKADAAGLARLCGECHDAVTEGLAGSLHGKNDLGCKDCHSVHAVKGDLSSEAVLPLCTECHEEAAAAVAQGPHGKTPGAGACAACHDPHTVTGVDRDRAALEKACGTCHESESRDQEISPHHKAEKGPGCKECHGVHRLTGLGLDSRGVSDFCGRCHEAEAKKFVGSTHEGMGQSCKDCHGTHNARGAQGKDALVMCGECHEEEMHLVQAGKHGDIEGAPGCSSCHDSHDVHGDHLSHPAMVATCGKCHDQEAAEYKISKHSLGKTSPGCVDCHGSHKMGGTGLNVQQETAFCSGCHPEESEVFGKSSHGLSPAGPSCTQCHGTHHTDWVEVVAPKEVMHFCGRCHEETVREYASNVHQVALEKGNEKAPHCVGCHGAHTMATVESPDEGWAYNFFLVECKNCHETFCDIAEKHDSLYRPDLHTTGPKLACGDCHVPREGTKGHILEAGVMPVLDCESCHDRGVLRRWAKLEWDLSMQSLLPSGTYVVGADPIGIPDVVGVLAVLGTILGMPLGHGSLRFLTGWLRKRQAR